MRKLGFSLIEIMLVVAILAVISIIAVPSYQGYVLKSRRISAKLALLSLSAKMENYYATHLTYVDADSSLGLPSDTRDGYYALSGSHLSAHTYTLSATAKGSQASDTVCASISLDQIGTRSPSECW